MRIALAVRKPFEEIASWPAIARQAEAAYRALIAGRVSSEARQDRAARFTGDIG